MTHRSQSSPPQLRWSGRGFAFEFPREPLLMGIVNVTPDSFSDGGRFLDAGAAIEHGERLVAEGADLLDIGGESTRPGAEPVDAAEELRRVRPVIDGLARRVKVPISVDTQKVEVAAAALDSGALIVNDIAANRDDEAMGRLVAARGAGYVAMHMQGTPQTMQANPRYADVVAEVGRFLEERMKTLRTLGVAGDQIVLDVGIGFGKTVGQNLQLLRALDSLHAAGRPLLLGASRKSFLAHVAGADHCGRLPGSLIVAADAVRRGVQILRVHDVAATREALRVDAELDGRTVEER